MLTAIDIVTEHRIAIPDFPDPAELRAPTTAGQLVCPVCRAELWLRAGHVRAAHFAHRTLADCPAANTSAAVLEALRLLYDFFKRRIDAGKLVASLELEPALPGVPPEVVVHLRLNRPPRSAVAIVLVDRRLPPDLRLTYQTALAPPSLVFRPVFLADTLRPVEDRAGEFNLDTTLREFGRPSPYDLRPSSWRPSLGSLHFLEPTTGEWTTLRGLTLVHDPHGFEPARVLRSRMEELLWSEGNTDWCHAGEAEALRRFDAARKRASPPPVPLPELPKPPPTIEVSTPTAALETAEIADEDTEVEETEDLGFEGIFGRIHGHRQGRRPDRDYRAAESVPLPEWMVNGLKCHGCGEPQRDWEQAMPGRGVCICRACFAKGFRLPST